MYLHIGQDVMIKKKDIIGIFDMDKTTISTRTRAFLREKERQGRVRMVTQEIPKSFVVCQHDDGETVYISLVSVGTLLRRMQQAGPADTIK